MKTILSSAAMIIALSGTAFAEGDAAKGEKDFKKCKACHTITSPEGEVMFKGGKTGPNLYGIYGAQAGTVEGFKYGASIVAAGEAGLTWNDEKLAAYIQDPKAFLKAELDDGAAKSKMTFKLKKPENVIAYLATFASDMAAEEAPAEAEAAESTEADSTASD